MPRVRSLEAVSLDALGAARRIRKGVNLRMESRRFSQLCDHIESIALELLREAKHSHERNSNLSFSEMYASQGPFVRRSQVSAFEVEDNRDESLASDFLRWINFAALNADDSHIAAELSQTVFPPGEALLSHCNTLAQLANGQIHAVPPDWHQDDVLEVRETLDVIIAFFKNCTNSDCGVVRITSMLPH